MMSADREPGAAAGLWKKRKTLAGGWLRGTEKGRGRAGKKQGVERFGVVGDVSTATAEPHGMHGMRAHVAPLPKLARRWTARRSGALHQSLLRRILARSAN
jgi:hypothetical protein